MPLGSNLDSNRNSGPDNHKLMIGGNIFNMGNSAAARENDLSAVVTTVVGFTHKLDTPTSDQALDRMGYYHGEQATLSSFDVDSFFAEAGRDFNTSNGKFTGKIFINLTRLWHQHFLNTVTAELRFGHKVDAQIRLYEAISAVDQNFQSIGENLVADNEDELLVNGTFGAYVRQAPDLLMNFKNAKQAFESYNGPEIGSTLTWLLGDGMF